MGWCACSRKCTRCLGSRGGDADGWSASASILCIPLQPHSSKALPRFSGDVYTCVVGAKSWQLHSLEVRGLNDFERAFEGTTREGTEALIVLSSALFVAERRQIVELVTKSRLPAMFPYQADAEAGGLMSYGPSLPDLFRRAATYVDKILKGA